MKALIVRVPFADYAKGDQITDPSVVDEISTGHNAEHVVAIQVADPAPATQPPVAAKPE